MRIVFIGCVSFSNIALNKTIEIGGNVVGIVTKKESPFNSDFCDVSTTGLKNNIPFFYTNDVNSSETINWILALNPEVIFCFGWSNLIKDELLGLAKYGVVGFHPAELPMNRGRHPIIWALALGLKKTASTFFIMNKGADSGDIISQKRIPIEYSDDATSLYKKIAETASLQIEKFLPLIATGKILRIKQNHSRANYWRKRVPSDGKIDFRMSSFAVYNLVRALTHPYIGASVSYKNEIFKVWKIEEVKNSINNIEPGKVISADNNTFIVKCYNDAVRFIEHDCKNIPAVGEYL